MIEGIKGRLERKTKPDDKIYCEVLECVQNSLKVARTLDRDIDQDEFLQSITRDYLELLRSLGVNKGTIHNAGVRPYIVPVCSPRLTPGVILDKLNGVNDGTRFRLDPHTESMQDSMLNVVELSPETIKRYNEFDVRGQVYRARGWMARVAIMKPRSGGSLDNSFPINDRSFNRDKRVKSYPDTLYASQLGIIDALSLALHSGGVDYRLFGGNSETIDFGHVYGRNLGSVVVNDRGTGDTVKMTGYQAWYPGGHWPEYVDLERADDPKRKIGRAVVLGLCKDLESSIKV